MLFCLDCKLYEIMLRILNLFLRILKMFLVLLWGIYICIYYFLNIRGFKFMRFYREEIFILRVCFIMNYIVIRYFLVFIVFCFYLVILLN